MRRSSGGAAPSEGEARFEPGAGRQRRGAMGSLKEELLKPIWHAFTALDLDRSGKVSKSQLKASPGEMGERLEPSTRRGD